MATTTKLSIYSFLHVSHWIKENITLASTDITKKHSRNKTLIVNVTPLQNVWKKLCYSYVSKFLMIPEKSGEKVGVRITVCPGVIGGSKFLNMSLKPLLKWMHALSQPLSQLEEDHRWVSVALWVVQMPSRGAEGEQSILSFCFFGGPSVKGWYAFFWKKMTWKDETYSFFSHNFLN